MAVKLQHVHIEACMTKLMSRLLMLEPVSSISVEKNFSFGAHPEHDLYLIRVYIWGNTSSKDLAVHELELQYINVPDEWVAFKFHQFVDTLWPNGEIK